MNEAWGSSLFSGQPPPLKNVRVNVMPLEGPSTKIDKKGGANAKQLVVLILHFDFSGLIPTPTL